MDDLVQQRCFNHKHREAVALCPECGRFFCRECITEHEDQVLCASCIGKRLNLSAVKPIRWGSFIGLFQILFGGMFIWIFFFYLGKILLSLPTAFHEGTLWPKGW